MVALLRTALGLVSVATIALAAWLAATVVLVLPSRDPEHVGLWAIVALGAAALAVVSWLAIQRTGAPTPPVTLALLGLGSAGVAFGLIVLGSWLSTALRADPEGYLLAIGVILLAHGLLALAWVAAGAASRVIRS